MLKTLLFGGLLIGGIAYANAKNNTNSGGFNPVPNPDQEPHPSPTPSGDGGSNDVLITNHDVVWDYKRESGVWYTRRKPSGNWINMQVSLTPANYSTAISRLEAHLAQGLSGFSNLL
ncbi:MAG: hypothetical protein F9K23_15780 [Bacteroidetes bacterium]|nr:MAG: hypothetical protein F9K23_15780 [Bacteroidota bacterium]